MARFLSFVVLMGMTVLSISWRAVSGEEAVPGPSATDWASQSPGSFVRRGHYYLTSEPGFAWDSTNGVFLGWGGHHLGQEQSHDVWALTPGHNAWRCMHPGLSPRAGCCSPQLSFDAHRGRMLSFGGNGEQSHGWMPVTVQGYEQSVPFVYDYGKNEWTRMRPVPEPPGGVRQNKGFTYHPRHRVHVLFSGGVEKFDDTWVYDAYDNEWIELHPENQPQGRKGHVLCFDPGSGDILMQGGSEQDARVYCFSLEENRWSPVEATNAPPRMHWSVFTYDPHAQAVVLAGLRTHSKNSHEMEIWRFDREKKTWLQVPLPATGEVPGRQHTLSALGFGGAYSPEENLYLFCGGGFGHGNFHTWTYRLAPTQELPANVDFCATIRTEVNSALLSWTPVRGAKRYEVWRGDGLRSWQSTFRKIAETRQSSYEVLNLERDSNVHFRLVALNDEGKVVSQDLVRTRPQAPTAPLVSVKSKERVVLRLPTASQDSVGFVIERAPVWTERFVNRFERVQTRMVLGNFEQIGDKTVYDTHWEDNIVLSSVAENRRFEAAENPICILYPSDLAPDPRWNPLAVYAYRLREVNRLGVVSGPSPWMTTLPQPPEPLRAHAPEVNDSDAGKVTLRWSPTEQLNIRGYRVYRQLTKLAGPAWRKKWLSLHHADPDRWHRLGSEDVTGREFRDESLAGGCARRRYFVTAVDAFGQEGPPSTGVWAYRPESFPTYEPVKSTPRVLIPELPGAVSLDGVANDAPWTRAVTMSLRFIDGRESKPTQATVVKMFTQAGKLFVHARCDESHMDEIKRHPDWPHDTNFLWKDDTIEFSFIAGADAEMPIHHLMLSAGPCHRDEYGMLGQRNKHAWNPGVEQAMKLEKDKWTIEFSIPLADFKAASPMPAVWRMNLFRNRLQSANRSLEESAWAPTLTDDPHVPSRFGFAGFKAFGAKGSDLEIRHP